MCIESVDWWDIENCCDTFGPNENEEVVFESIHPLSNNHLIFEEYKKIDPDGTRQGFDTQFFIPLEDWNQMDEEIKLAIAAKEIEQQGIDEARILDKFYKKH